MPPGATDRRRQSEELKESARLPKRFRRRLVPRGSQRDPDIRRTVSRYVKSLIQLYEMTDPAYGAASEDNKLEYARQAISIWWYLFGELLLWAQSHLAGYEIGRSNPRFMHKLAETFGREIDVDSHVLEYIGLGFSWNRVNYDDLRWKKLKRRWKKTRWESTIQRSGPSSANCSSLGPRIIPFGAFHCNALSSHWTLDTSRTS
jgi:hypothetical protein